MCENFCLPLLFTFESVFQGQKQQVGVASRRGKLASWGRLANVTSQQVGPASNSPLSAFPACEQSSNLRIDFS